MYKVYYTARSNACPSPCYIEKDYAALPHPLAVIYKKTPQRKKLGGYTLHFVDSTAGVSEALLIRAALSILAEDGHKNLTLDLNSIGDKESLNVYERELHSHVRKSSAPLDVELRENLKKDIFHLFRGEDTSSKLLRESVPSSISFLTPTSRNYFKEVLEYIEMLNVEFRLAPELVGDKHYCSHTIFAIRNTDAEVSHTLALGYSYSRLGKRLGLKREIPMVAVTIFFEPRTVPIRVYKELPRPKFYLVQLGREAKMKSLSLIEHLRMHRIPVAHLVGRDKITAQLAGAEAARVSHLIILGQKEALDGTATVRNVSTRAQETVSMEALPLFLKNISL